jgi:hypothetical protein
MIAEVLAEEQQNRPVNNKQERFQSILSKKKSSKCLQAAAKATYRRSAIPKRIREEATSKPEDLKYRVVRLNSRKKKNGKVLYLVRWMDTWEPKANIDQGLIYEYEERKGIKKRRRPSFSSDSYTGEGP